MCVAKLFPEAAHSSRAPAYEHPNSSMNTSTSFSSHGLLGPQHNGENNNNSGNQEEELDTSVEWYCPRHFCVDCGALQTVTNIALDTLPLPPILYETAMNTRSQQRQQDDNNSQLIVEKMLKQCKTCPFAMCLECEEMLSEEFQSTFFYSFSALNIAGGSASSLPQQQQPGHVAARTRHSNPNNHHSNSHSNNTQQENQQSSQQCTCIHCHEAQSTSTDFTMDSLGGKLKLAKCLEVAWVKMTTSRLALPFFRPLLPETVATPSTPTTVHRDDLMSILENIHALKYQRIGELSNDLHEFIGNVVHYLEKPSSQPQREDVLVTAIKTIISAAEGYLKGRKKDFEGTFPYEDPSTVKKRQLSHSDVSPRTSVWWRIECHFHPLLYSHPLRSLLQLTQASNEDQVDHVRQTFHKQNNVDLVLPRSLLAWRAYAKHGDDYAKRAAAWKEKIHADGNNEGNDDEQEEDGDNNGNAKSKNKGKGSKEKAREQVLEESRARQMIRRTLRDVLASSPSNQSSSNQMKGMNIGNVYHLPRKGDETAARLVSFSSVFYFPFDSDVCCRQQIWMQRDS